MRLFIGVPLPYDIREELATIFLGIQGASWEKIENLHITLSFVGKVPGREIYAIDEVLDKIKMGTFIIRLSEIGCFLRGRRLSSVWLGVSPQKYLVVLQKKVERAIINAGFLGSRRKFTPHVTLARFKSSNIELTKYLEIYSQFRTNEFLVDRFTLFESYITKKGAEYLEIKDYELAKF